MHDLIWNTARFSPEDLELKNNWVRLYNQTRTSALSMEYTWFKSLAEACQRFSIVPQIFEVRDKRLDKIVALIPYTLQDEKIYRFFSVRVAHLMRLNHEYGDHYDLLIASDYYEDTVKLLAKWMKQDKIDLCAIDNMEAKSKFRLLSPKSSRMPLLTSTIQTIACLYIGLPEKNKSKDWCAINFKRTMQYKRKLEREFHVSYGRIEKESEIDEILTQYKIMHTARFASKGTSCSICSDPAQYAFLEKLIYNAFYDRFLICNFIKLNGKVACVEISFLINGKLFAYTAAFDESYAKYRLGAIQTLVMLEKAIAENADVVDLLQGDEGYKKLWAKDLQLDYNMVLFQKNFYGYFLYIVTIFRKPLQLLYRATTSIMIFLQKVSALLPSRELSAWILSRARLRTKTRINSNI